MKFEEIEYIIRIIQNGNSDNYYINNKGLASLGAVIFYPKKEEESRSQKIKELLKETFNEEEYKIILQSLRKYHFTSYYTGDEIINFQIDLLKKNGIVPKRILEPSAGNGAYVQKLKKAFPEAQIIALEPDLLSYKILSLNNQKNKNVECINSSFEEYYFENSNKEKFDLVISNIPFGDFSISKAFKHDYLTEKEKNVNVFFNKYCNEILNEQGFSFILTSKNFLDKSSYQDIRESIISKADLINAFRFNNELFKNEKTKVVSDLIIYQRNENKNIENLSQEEKYFINTINVEIEENIFQINQFFHEKMNQINGDLAHGIFHQKPDLTIVPNNISLKEYLEKGLETNLSLGELSSDLKNNKKEILEEKNITPSKNQNDIVIDNVKIENEDVSNHKSTSINKDSNNKITTNDFDYLKKHTRLYLGSYNYINSKLYYVISDLERKEVKSKKHIDLLNGYIPLRNEYVVFYDNIINNRLNQNEITSGYENINYMLDMFHFQYGYLKTFQVELQDDFYFDKIHSVLEKINPERINQLNKYIKNDNFNLDYFLQFKKEETKIDKSPEENLKENKFPDKAKKNTSELFNNFDNINISKPEFNSSDSLKTNIHKYYDFYGKIDIDFISNLYKETPQNLLEKGFNEKLFYLNPIFNEHNQFTKFQIDLFFLVESGHIENKIQAYQNEKLPIEINTEGICNYLTSIKNEKLDIIDIEFNYESFFIPIEAKKEFFKDLVNENITPLFGQFEQNVNLIFEREHNPVAHEMYSVKADFNSNTNEGKENKIKTEYNYKKLFQNFVENVYPVVYYTVEEGEKKVRKIDANATIIAQNKYEQLHLEFKSFIHNNIKYKEITENNYYNYFLAEKEIKINENILSYPKTLVHKPYEHQLSSVLYALNRGTSLNDHKVGHGKSVSMGLLADKLIQHNKAERTLLITLKSVSEQLFKELQTNFPHINMFLLNKKNFTAKKREATLKYLKDSNVQLIVAEHTHIQRLPKSEEYIKTIYGKYIDMVEQDLEAAKLHGTKETKGIIKGLEKRKGNLENKLDSILNKLKKKASSVTFEDLKIEALLVDEAHEFKNIQYTTRHENVAGLNNSSESDKNFDLETSIYSIHERTEKDKNIFFYSGTPIKNSVTELYAYQRYLTPYELVRKNINNFDSWASIFLKQSVQAESDIFGQARMHKRWRYFTNMPELAKMYRSFSHISDEKTFKTHNVNIKTEFKVLESTPGYDELKEASIIFAKDKRQEALFGYDKYTPESMQSSYVTALGINRRCLVDPLLEKDLAIPFDEEDQIKIKAAVKDAYDIYKMSEKDKGVVLIFSDIGVWKPNKYNTYDTIRSILHNQYNVPLSEIGIAQENTKDFKTYQEKIRNGDIRIAIGSTKTLGTGTNIQDRVIGVIEIDIPYSPDASEQRTGRMARAGNWICEKYDKIGYNYSYGIKDSTDIFSYSLNKHKSIFINQIKEINHKNRIYDDFFTDTNNMSYAQKEAMLIGDMDTFKLVKLEDDLKALKAQKTMFDIGKNNAAKKIETFEQTNNILIKEINQLRKVYNELKEFIPEVNEDDKLKDIERKSTEKINQLFFPVFQTEKFTNFEQVNNYILKKISDLNALNIGEHKLKKFNDFDIYLTMNTVKTFGKNSHSFNLNLNEIKMTINGSAQYKFDNSKIGFQIFKLIKKIPEVIRNKEHEINYNLRTIESNKKNSISQFPEGKLVEMEKLEKEIKKIKRKKLE